MTIRGAFWIRLSGRVMGCMPRAVWFLVNHPYQKSTANEELALAA